MKNRRTGLFVFLPVLLAACAAAAPEPPPPAAAATTSGLEQPQPSAAEPVSPSDLNGTWVEYWAVNGKADTERYAFTQPNRFSWQAAKQEQPQAAVGKTGTFRLEPHGKATFLVLEVEQETVGDPGAPREIKHRTPLIERYELGECPANPEAQGLDAEYTCRAIGGKAFWRKTREPSASELGAAAG